MTRYLPAVLFAALTVALVAAACGGDKDPLAPLPDIESEETVTTSSTATTSTNEETSSTSDAEDTEDPADAEDAAEAAALETWTTLFGAAATGLPDAEQLETIAQLSSDNTTTQLEDFFPADPDRVLNHFAKLTRQDDGTYAIDDCIIMNRPFSTDLSTWFIGHADPYPDSPTGYIITNIQLINLEPCVPSSIAEAAIQGYENHQDARLAFFDPPNPDAPELRATTTGTFLDFNLDLIERLDAAGQRLVGRAKTQPRFLLVNSPTELVIVDCQIADPERGVYNIETGERTDLIPPIKPGQIDLVETTLVLEDDVWRASDTQGGEDIAECESMPFNEAILQIRGG